MKLSKRRKLIALPLQTKAERAALVARLIRSGMLLEEARRVIKEVRTRALRKPLKGEKCEARTRKGAPCQAPAGPNGRCKLHGGRSTGARTSAGQMRAYGHLLPNNGKKRNL